MTRRTPAQYDWTRALFNDRRLSKHFTSPRRSSIKTVTLHHMTIVVPGSGSDSTRSLEGCYNTWQTRQASANYGVSGNQVWQYVSDNDAAWANASSSNHETLSIEHTNSTGAPTWQVSDETMKTGARLTASLHRLYGLGRPSRKTVKMHRDYYATACPGPYMVDHLSAYIAEAARVYDAMGKPSPEPPVDPPVEMGPEVVSTTLNAASYNATGAKSYKGRTDRYVARRLKYPADILNFQEVGNGANRAGHPNCLMRPRLDSKLASTYKRRYGSDGRYNYTNLLRVKHIKGGVITAASSTWFNRDDKQAAWEIYEKDGVRAMDVSFHLENEDGAVADAKRVASMLNILAQALVIAAANGVDVRNILFTGDTNSQGMVAAAMKIAHWRNVAVGTEYENAHTFMGWDGRSRDRYDYGFVHEAAGPAAVTAVHRDTDISDHAELVIRRHLTRINA